MRESGQNQTRTIKIPIKNNIDELIYKRIRQFEIKYMRKPEYIMLGSSSMLRLSAKLREETPYRQLSLVTTFMGLPVLLIDKQGIFLGVQDHVSNIALIFESERRKRS